MTEEGLIDSCQAVIGALALDIRESWRQNVEERIGLMRALARRAALEYPQLDDKEFVRACVKDGRTMRDVWIGPYGRCDPEDLKAVGLKEEDIFEED
jgi:hypothetical protein